MSTMQEIDGGQFGMNSIEPHPAPTQMDAAFREVCVLQGMEPVKTEAVPLDKLDELLAANESIVVPEPVPLDTYPVPDNSMSMDAFPEHNYPDDDLLPLSRERAYALMDDGFTVYSVQDAGGAVMCLDRDEIDALPADTLFAVAKEEWEESPAFDERIQDRLNHQEDREAAFQSYPGDAFAIYQMRMDQEGKFLSYDQQKDGVYREDYDLIYTHAGLPEGAATADLLENLFFDFNQQRPADYHAHSLSVSDIIALKQGGTVTYHYCDSFGFQELPEFALRDNPLKNAEMSMEDDYDMIDGIINNGPKQPTVEELEAQVKAGQSISVMDLANAVQAERKDKKPSMLERLRQPAPKQEHKSKAPKKRREQER